MIGGLTHIFDNLLGRGEAAVTVPALDGALRPNRQLDEAPSRIKLEDVDCVVVHGGAVLASAGHRIFALTDRAWAERSAKRTRISCLAVIGDGLAIALADGEILIEGGPFDGRSYWLDGKASCITALAGTSRALYVAVGSATNGPEAWQRDLLERNASGSLWQIDLKSGAATRLAQGLAWPAGLVVDEAGLVFSEAWKHQLVRLEIAAPRAKTIVYADLPGYPGRIAPAAGGYWLALFAPRSQLVEFVLREPAYRKRMMAEVPQAYWVAPRLRSGHSFYESLQGGGVKHLGQLKAWAPSTSAGFCVKLDSSFQPRASLQSRADGTTHGVTSAAERDGRVYVAARGDGVVVSLPLAALESDAGGAS
jgi:hypothetical protein